MNKLILLLLTPLVHSDEYAVCYYCSSDSNDDIYDPECATDGYDGPNWALTYSCYTDIYANGMVKRNVDTGIHDDGECKYIPGSPDKWRCYCDTNNCNNNLCQHCYDVTAFTQGSTTEDPETTTATHPVTTFTTTTPGCITHPGTTMTGLPTTISTMNPGNTTTTAKPSQGLTCYSCLNCSSTDDNTITATDINFQTCVTAIL
ncbi:unnamed protein product, partial [Meganyctiphanes norvegica]